MNLIQRDKYATLAALLVKEWQAEIAPEDNANFPGLPESLHMAQNQLLAEMYLDRFITTDESCFSVTGLVTSKQNCCVIYILVCDPGYRCTMYINCVSGLITSL